MQANQFQPMPFNYGFDAGVADPRFGGGFLHRMLGQFQGGYGQQPHQQQGGYDSSGINLHGMYSGTFGQPQAPHNPGGFQPMGLPQLMQFNRPAGLAAMFAR